MTKAPSWVLLCVALASSASMWLAFRWFADPNHLVWVWPVTAIQVALILPVWGERKLRHWGITGGLLGNTLTAHLLGMPVWFSLTVGFTSALEVTVAGVIIGRKIRGFEDLKERSNLKLFAVAVIAAPLVGGVLGAISASYLLHEPLLQMLPLSVLADGLGMAVVLPVLLFHLTGKYRQPSKLAPYFARGLPPALLFIAVAIGVFSQTSYPVLFIIFPPLVLLIMLMGLEGAVFANVVVVCVACYATAHGHGPIWLARAGTWEDRVMMLQLFLWMVVATGVPIGALLDEQQRTAIKANDARAIYLTLLENTSDMIILSSFDGQQRFISAASEALTGWTPEEFALLDRLSTFHPDDVSTANMVMQSMMEGKREHQFRYRIRQKNGGWRWVEASARAYADEATGEVRGYVGTIRDIASVIKTEAEHEQLSLAQERLDILSKTDALTMMPNRRAFDHALDQHILGLRPNTGAALLMLDIDYFKSFNDQYGHQAGDVCLRKVGQAIRGALLRSGDVAARWGGEEFCVLMPGAPAAVSERTAANILAAVQCLQIPHAGNPEGFVTVSIGIAVRSNESEDPSLWIQRADKALYASKQLGKNRWTAAPETIPIAREQCEAT